MFSVGGFFHDLQTVHMLRVASRFAGCGVGEDLGAALAFQRAHLARQILLRRAHASIADKLSRKSFRGFRCATHFSNG